MKTAFERRIEMKVLKAAAFYFLILFGAGFVLGILRVLWAAPRFGERAAELSEMPLMLVAMLLAARRTVRHFSIPQAAPASMGVGLIALGFLLAAESTVVLKLQGLTFTEYVAGRDPVSGTVYVLMLIAFAFMPWFAAGRRSNVISRVRA
jgi:hypothetical protein